MKKVLIIVGVIILVIGLSTGGYVFFIKDKDNKNGSSDTASQSTEGSNQFSPVSTENIPMVASISTTQDGEKSTIVMEFDGKGTSEYTIEQEGEETRFVTTKDAYYICKNSGCFKYANSQEQSGATNPDQYEYSQTDIDSFKSNAAYKGQKSCGSETCDVWEVANFNGTGTATFYLDDSGRIVKIESTFNGSSSTISYEYKNVTIEIPADAQELPSGI